VNPLTGEKFPKTMLRKSPKEAPKISGIWKLKFSLEPEVLWAKLANRKGMACEGILRELYSAPGQNVQMNKEP